MPGSNPAGNRKQRQERQLADERAARRAGGMKVQVVPVSDFSSHRC
ncbi:hypothetical protein D8I24_1827 [Cupriavidus necator H850]|nr:hypothetical protein D8I24_1827 [Cupriavidus necator H850]